MDLVFIGTIIDTHGIKGEIKIRSDFEYKNLVFKPGVEIYIDNKPHKIVTYRYHKVYDMVTLEGYNNINDVIPFKKKKVYVDRSILNLDKEDYLLNDLIGCHIFIDNKDLGEVKDYTTGVNPLLIVSINNKEKYIPNNKDFIKNVDITNKKIELNDIASGVLKWK